MELAVKIFVFVFGEIFQRHLKNKAIRPGRGKRDSPRESWLDDAQATGRQKRLVVEPGGRRVDGDRGFLGKREVNAASLRIGDDTDARRRFGTSAWEYDVVEIAIVVLENDSVTGAYVEHRGHECRRLSVWRRDADVYAV